MTKTCPELYRINFSVIAHPHHIQLPNREALTADGNPDDPSIYDQGPTSYTLEVAKSQQEFYL
jgi:hypothetical protein